MSDRTHNDAESSTDGGIARRLLLGGAAAAGLATVASASPPGEGRGRGNGRSNGNDRLQRAFRLRKRAAKDTLQGAVGGRGSYGRFDAKHGTFTKALPHDAAGEVDLGAYEQLDAALAGVDVDAYNEIPLAKDRGLANPIAARAFNLEGADGHEKPMPPAPELGSDTGAAEMVELYWRALLRDVPFADYDDHPAAQVAYEELAALDGYEGPSGNGPRDLFRSPYPGARTGPHVSQFLLQDAPYGTMTVRNELTPQEPGVDFMTSFDDWLAVRRGDGSPIRTEQFAEESRRITTGRDLLTYVHRNVPSQSALTAGYYLLGEGVPFAPEVVDTPLETQNTFVETGPPTVPALVGGVVDNAKHATWYHKWLVHRRARPEKYGGLVEVHRNRDRTYPFLNDALLDSTAVARTESANGTALLPQGYPEGSPTHPSYPAGHSVFIGASVTVLKALFDTSHELDRTVRVTSDGTQTETNATLTVGGELNKLASNHAFGRDFAGIHYRSDGREGHLLGERVALAYLRDELRGTAVDFALSLDGFRGESITVTQDRVRRE